MSIKTRFLKFRNNLREKTRPLREKIQLKLRPMRRAVALYVSMALEALHNSYLSIKAALPFKTIALPRTHSTVNAGLMSKINEREEFLDCVEDEIEMRSIYREQSGVDLAISDIDEMIEYIHSSNESDVYNRQDGYFSNESSSDEFEKVEPDDNEDEIKLVVKRRSRLEDEWELP